MWTLTRKIRFFETELGLTVNILNATNLPEEAVGGYVLG